MLSEARFHQIPESVEIFCLHGSSGWTFFSLKFSSTWWCDEVSFSNPSLLHGAQSEFQA
jgi:hypothetical protein